MYGIPCCILGLSFLGFQSVRSNSLREEKMRAIQCAGWTTVFFVRVRGVVRTMSVASIISLVLWGGDATAFMDVVCKNQSCLSSG